MSPQAAARRGKHERHPANPAGSGGAAARAAADPVHVAKSGRGATSAPDSGPRPSSGERAGALDRFATRDGQPTNIKGWVREARAAQGLPRTVTDNAVLSAVVKLVLAVRARDPYGRVQIPR